MPRVGRRRGPLNASYTPSLPAAGISLTLSTRQRSRQATQSNAEGQCMTKLDPTFSSFTEIDSHALDTVMGGNGLKNPKPPGKLKRGIGLLGLLAGVILGPHEPPSPED